MGSSKRRALVWGAASAVLFVAVVALILWERNRTQLLWQAGFLPGNPQRGGQIFADRGCSGCHSILGVGGKRAVDLAHAHRSPTDLTEVVAVMWNHAPEMWEMIGDEPIPELSPRDASDLMAFLFAAGYLEEEGDRRAGEAVLAKKKCSGCHATGEREVHVGPDLTRWATRVNPILWAAALWNHAPGMEQAMTEEGVAWPTFEQKEIVDLLTFLREVSGAPRRSPPLPGDPWKGRALFGDHCRRCHQAEGEGGEVGPNLGASPQSRTLSGLSASLWNHAPAMNESMKDMGVEHPSFTEAEMADLITYLFAIRYFDPPGNAELGRAVYQKSCGTCHGEGALGTSDGPSLAKLGSRLSATYMTSTLWNHGPRMFQEMRAKGVEWPVFETTQMRDLIEYLRGVGSDS